MLNLAVKYITNMELKVISWPNFFDGEHKLIHRLFENGMPCFHLRKPNSSVEQLETFLQKIDSKYYDKIVVHDYVQLAQKYRLKGVHFTFRTKGLIDSEYSNLVKSSSCHSLDELIKLSSIVDDVLLSPIYDSISKEDYKASYNWNELEAVFSSNLNCQVFALGGVTVDKIEELKNIGFNGIAILGGVWQNTNPVDALIQFQNKLL